VVELSHKPFPSGRATHGGIDGLWQLIAAHGIAADAVRAGRFLVPQLTHRLVGRLPQLDMTAAYARLCLAYVGGVCLRRGTVATDDFTPEALANPGTIDLARRLVVIADANPDPNALAPVRVELDLADRTTLACDVTEIIGSPARALAGCRPRQVRGVLPPGIGCRGRSGRRAVERRDGARNARRCRFCRPTHDARAMNRLSAMDKFTGS
jgi:2-methylcitrate dehydratase PrpD